jgi:hypothetical protein
LPTSTGTVPEYRPGTGSPIKRRVRASQHFRSFWGAWRTIAGYEAIHMMRKGQACESAPGGRAILPHRFTAACSARWRSNIADAIAKLRLNSRVATLPFGRRTESFFQHTQ